MNIGNKVNIPVFPAALESALADRLRALLGEVTWLKGVKVAALAGSSEAGFDLLATLPLPAGSSGPCCFISRALRGPNAGCN